MSIAELSESYTNWPDGMNACVRNINEFNLMYSRNGYCFALKEAIVTAAMLVG